MSRSCQFLIIILSAVGAVRELPAQLAINVFHRPGRATVDRQPDPLKRLVDWDFVEIPLGDLCEDIERKYGIAVQPDRRALEANGCGTDTPVSVSVRGITLHSALSLVLRAHNLTWMIRDEVLVITTQEEAESELLTRVYPVRDLRTAAGLAEE